MLNSYVYNLLIFIFATKKVSSPFSEGLLSFAAQKQTQSLLDGLHLMARLAHSTIRNSFLALSCVLLAFFVVLQISSFENRPKPADAQQGRTNIEATVTQGGPQFKCRPLSYTSSDLVLPLSDPWGTSLRLEPVKWGTKFISPFPRFVKRFIVPHLISVKKV